MRIAGALLALFIAPAVHALPVTDNDASCDISLLPAATLLLPYFEVDLADPMLQNTVFTITNVAPAPHVARVTLWTDRSYPVFAFDAFLTGYDVEESEIASQNWVIVSMAAEGRYSLDFDAPALANGCPPVAPPMEE